MTVEQVFNFVKKKADTGNAIMIQTLNELNYYKDQGYYFNVIGDDMLAMKYNEEPIKFCFGGLRDLIELEDLTYVWKC